MEMNVVILFLAGSALFVALVLLRLGRNKRQGRYQGTKDREAALERIAILRSQFPNPTDQKACDRIEAEVRTVSRHFSMSTSIAPKKIYGLAEDLTKEIAGLYHPEADNPVMQVSISDLLQLNERIVTRLNLKLREFPLKTIKDINLDKILKSKDFYDAKIKNKLAWFKKYKTLYTIGNQAWLTYNAMNPWYWGRKFAYTSAREITFRYLLTWIITIVGEEAMAVFSRRDINTREAAFERDLAFAMVDMARAMEDFPKEGYGMVLDHVLNQARLSDVVRVTILRALTLKGSGEMFAPTGAYTEKQREQLLENVRRVATAGSMPGREIEKRLDAIKNALAPVSDDDQ